MINEAVILEVVFAVDQRRLLCEARGNEREAQLFNRYIRSLLDALGVANGGKPALEQLKRVGSDTHSLASCMVLDKLLPFPRSRVACREMTKLARRLSRAERGLPPKLWGIIG